MSAHVIDMVARLKNKGLSSKGLLVVLSRSSFRSYKQDKTATETVELATGVAGAGHFSKHLFKSKNNRVRIADAASAEVYAYVKSLTLPWLDGGVRLLPATIYMEFTQGLAGLIAKAEAAADDLAAHWQQEIADDMRRLGPMANRDDYPDDIRSKYAIKVRYMPVPDAGDFRVDVANEHVEDLAKELEEIEKSTSKYIMQQLLQPMEAAVARLAEYRGDKGQRFHDATITNIIEVADRMAKLNISGDADVDAAIAAVRQQLGVYAENTDALRTTELAREQCSNTIDDLMKQFAGLV